MSLVGWTFVADVCLAAILVEASVISSGPLPTTSPTLQVSGFQGGWTNVSPTLSPPPMAGGMMAYSSNANRFVLFGGWDGTEGLNQTWVFDPVNGTWSELHVSSSPVPRGDEMFVYEERSDSFVLFGGWYEFPNGTYIRLADTWTFSLTTKAWTQRHPPVSPSPRSDSEAAYDSEAGAMLMIGGFSGADYLGDVWAYFPSNDSWSPRQATTIPSARADGRMVYVESQDRFILFGGNNYNGPNFTFHHLADTWSYSWNSNTWTILPTHVAPSPRDYPVFAIDQSKGTALLVSGYANRTILNDTWGFNLTTNTWSNLAPQASPPARYAAAGGFDPIEGVFVLFSGAGSSGLLHDTWYYSYEPEASQPSVFPAAFILAFGAVGVAVLGVATGLFIIRWRRGRR